MEKHDEAVEFAGLGKAINRLVTDRGLGAISKKDYELLVFYHLSNTTTLAGKDNYSLANHFKVTETKIKSLRLESSLRHQPADHKQVLKRIAQRVLDQAKNSDVENGKIVITLEDPVERREFEYAAKQANHRVEYGLNRENLEISLLALFEVVLSNTGDEDKALKNIVQAKIADKRKQKELLDQSRTKGQRIVEVGKYFVEKGLLSTVLSTVLSGLG